MHRTDQRVLAIGIDAAEPSLALRLVGNGTLPSLRGLLDAGGTWSRVVSPSDIGSGAVWPTFISGSPPSRHGIHGEWCWRPDRMDLQRYAGGGLDPFWRRAAEAGRTVGVFDVPFMPSIGLQSGFEIAEWGAHDVVAGRLSASPPGLAPLLGPRHPLGLDRLDVGGPEDAEGLARMSRLCLEGVRRRGDLAERLIAATRPDLALIVFPEVHHASHYLWHEVEPDHAIYAAAPRRLRPIAPGLEHIFREVDAQVGRLIASMGDGAAVLVFSLHGMKPARGIPDLLRSLLCEVGASVIAGFNRQSWGARARSAFAAAKRLAPRRLKQVYYGVTPGAATRRLAQPTMMPAYDWSRTQAFSLPTDQHGWVRANLAGREAHGIVSPEDYNRLCDRLERLLRGLVTDGGTRVVQDVRRTASCGREALDSRLPDLVIHWDDGAFEAPLQLRGFPVSAPSVGLKFTGQHAVDGFCVASPGVIATGDLRAEDLHRVLLGSSGQGCRA